MAEWAFKWHWDEIYEEYSPIPFNTLSGEKKKKKKWADKPPSTPRLPPATVLKKKTISKQKLNWRDEDVVGGVHTVVCVGFAAFTDMMPLFHRGRVLLPETNVGFFKLL